jgi:methyl-accepting chemotaxis protein
MKDKFTMNDDLTRLRDTVNRWMVLFLWLHVPIAVAVSWAAGNGWFWPGVLAAVIAAFATAAWTFSPSSVSTRVTIAVAAVAMVSVILAAARGSSFQIDGHLYYFAMLAILAAYCDWRVILAAAAATAIHHLSLNFIAPALIFPGGGDLPRVVLHAVVLILEASALAFLTHRISSLFELSAKNLAGMEAASLAAAAQADQAAALRLTAENARQAAADLRIEAAEKQAKVMDAIGHGLEKAASGDLVYRLAQEFPPEFKKLQTDFNGAMETLRVAMASVAGSTSTIRASAQEIAGASDDLARRTEQQAASLEQTAAALDEITATVGKTAEGANEARAIVATATADAQRSGEVVSQTIGAMTAIETSSSQIGGIVGVIDEIAFQTNLLALNAGVEAARAGDAGRGFAVVATEVRALAQRSAAAAKEIKALIAASGVQVAAGVRLVDETGKALSRTLGQVTEINRLVSEIASSAHEQSSGLKEVNTAVNQMDQVTQQNAAMVEETSAAAQGLVEETVQLAGLMARFQIDTATAQQTRRGGVVLDKVREMV